MKEKTKRLLKGLLIGVTGLAGVSGWALFVAERKDHAKTLGERFNYETKTKDFAGLIVRREQWLREGASKSWLGLLPSEERTIRDAKDVYREAYGPLIEDIEKKEDTPE